MGQSMKMRARRFWWRGVDHLEARGAQLVCGSIQDAHNRDSYIILVPLSGGFTFEQRLCAVCFPKQG